MHLPPAIDLYVKAENAGDVESLAECFASDAIVRDEGHTYEGLAAIKAWKAETKKRYNHIVEPLEVAQRDGKTVLKAKLSGNFPGSPVTLAFSFVFEDGKITSLEIR
jgi:ketosteroid isomerase-like protein